MSDNFNNYEDDVLNEFSRFRSNQHDLSKTMVIPRVEDLIEERPLQQAASAEELFSASDLAEAVKAEETVTVMSRRAKKSGELQKTMRSIKEKVPKAPKKEKRPKKKGSKKHTLKWILLAILALGLCCVIGVCIFVGNTVKNAPKINPDNIYELLSENSIIYDRNGVVVDNIYSGDSLRTNLEFNEIPDQLIQSFVSIEDKTFWTHKGFNIIRMFGAVWQKVSGQSSRIGGTSTITQQLARNLYLADIKSQRSVARKVTEAYYTIQLEKKLSKEQIIEAYLNTIYLGYNCNGVAAAAEAYFSKDVSELNLLECCQLAALPQSPNNYAPLKRQATAEIADFDSLDIISKTDDWTVYFNDAASDRVKLVLYYLHDQGKINDATYEAAKADSIRNYLNPGSSAVNTDTTSYFADYVKGEVLKDLIAAGYDEETASNLLYNGGLRINSTVDLKVQSIMDKEYENADNFPGVKIQWKDSLGNALDSNKKVLLYNMEHYFTEDGNFILGADEYKELPNGDLLIYSGKRLNFYKTSVGGNIDYSAEFKNLYEMVDGVCYSRAGGVWNIPSEYKDRDSDGNLILSHEYFAEKPAAFTKNSDGTITLSKDYFTLKQRVRQPQSAMVIMDYKTGEILGMIGGRDLQGKLLYNRATSSRQPGSSIKPLAIYSTALQLGAEGVPGYTAAMTLDDAPIFFGGQLWPKNWYDGYKGITNLRHAVEQSINACAVNLYMKMADPDRCIEQLQKMGITSVVSEKDNPEINDANASALALGGMTHGISPLQMTAAYGTFGNYGQYTEPICYTSVTTKSGDVVLEKTPSHMEVMDEAVASLMTDILRTVVTHGLGSPAKLKSQPSAGKTGTTSERYDIWFCGLTPQYSAACWIGSDVNIPVNSDSSKAAKLWAKIMDQVCADLPREEFQMKGEFVTATVDKYSGGYSAFMNEESALTEIFIKGTEPAATGYTEPIGQASATVCAESGYLATPLCPGVSKIGIVRPGGMSWEKQLAIFTASLKEGDKELTVGVDGIEDAIYDLPDFYCPIHNPNPEMYPISPFNAQHTGTDIEYGEENIPEVDPETGEILENLGEAIDAELEFWRNLLGN